MKQSKKYILKTISLALLSTAVTLAQGNKLAPVLTNDITTFVPYSTTKILNTNQHHIADKIISIFENSTTDIRYDYAEVVADDKEHGITAGRLGFTSATGDMLEFFKEYYNHAPFSKYISELERLDALYAANDYEVSNNPNGSMNVDNLDGLIEDWHNEGKKIAFQKAQDKYLDEHYYTPAMKVANKVGLELPISLLCFYDTAIQHGVDGLKNIVSQVNLAYPKNQEEEIRWIKQFNQKRLEILQSKSYWKDSVYRVETLNDLIKDKKYFLNIDKIIIRSWGNEEFVINHTLKNNNNKINDISVSSTDTYLTLAMNGEFIEGSHGSFFIDADNDSTTGYSAGSVKGADYLVQHSALYRYPDDAKGWKWDKISSEVKTETKTNQIISNIPLNMMDITDESIKYIGAVSMPNWKNRINYKEMQEYKILEGNNENRVVIGARPVKFTSFSRGTLFASPAGNGDCSKEDPCNIYTAFSKVSAGDVLFLRGGKYVLNKTLLVPRSGTKEKFIIIESYPNENAILTANATKDNAKELGTKINQAIYIVGKNYIKIRKLEIMHMGGRGIFLLAASNNTIEGCTIHDNFYNGIQIYRNDKSNNNLVTDNIIYHNSDAGLTQIEGKDTLGYRNGNNSDGISVSSGNNNKIVHNTVYNNSDDGIDTWKSNGTYVAYNKVYGNGLAQGDGNGIKTGGDKNYLNSQVLPPYGKNAIVEHNLVYNNRANGIDVNMGRNVTFKYNTSYKNGRHGFITIHDTKTQYNISSNNKRDAATQYMGGGNYIDDSSENNSWILANNISFISINPNSKDFLKPIAGLEFENMGTYANLYKEQNNNVKNIKIFVIGDSTVYNKDDAHEMGWAEKDALGTYMKYPDNLFDEGQSGASSTSYKIVLDDKHDWEETKDLIENSDISDGAYLLIQFGHNNKDYDYEQYANDLKEYIDASRALGVVPVLVTPVQRLWKYTNSHKDLPKTMKEVAEEKNVLLLDLNEKSKQIFSTYKSHEDVQSTFGYDDHTHFNPKGAKIVSGWVKDLICEKDAKLCAVFQ